MNIFEELAESYTYNGTISLKALEDDIVTLENQIDAYNSTLMEVRLRRRNDKLILEKIRDAKIRLSLLKAFYKRESDKTTPDDIILNMLGVSGKSAKETETVETAASGKQPVQQNFESSELEKGVNAEEKLSAGVPVEAVVTENVSEDEAVEIERAEEEAKESVLKEATDEKDIIQAVNVEEEKDTTELSTVKAESGYKTREFKNVETEKTNDKDIPQEVRLGKETDIPETDITELETSEELTDENNVIGIEFDKDVVDDKPVEKYKVDEGVYDLRSASEEELLDFFNTLKDTDAICVKTPPKQKEEKDTPSSLFETENESKEFIQNMKVEKETDENPQIVDCEKIEECNLPDCPPPTMEDYFEPIDDKVVVDEFEVPENDDLNSVTDAFPEDVCSMTVSVDLSHYTNMVNTATIVPYYDQENKTLELTFTDLRDYPHFLFFMNELKENKCRLFRKAKNPRSIFMVVKNEIEDIKETYTFEFTDCKLISLHDSQYVPLYTNSVFADDNSTHIFNVKFKYKELIVK